jgi:hypothetical protein
MWTVNLICVEVVSWLITSLGSSFWVQLLMSTFVNSWINNPHLFKDSAANKSKPIQLS